ncbi:MAG: ATP-binding cassette domain-containing protein [Eubacteriales bacterium]|nr:ATP-binding cassette domain-containing protein [Eubacteriales bacterium]
MSSNEVILELKDLKTWFKVEAGTLKAVNGVDLTIHKGETLGLVGESGCGKSTLGRTIMRLYKPDGGQVLYKGKDIWKYKKPEIKTFRKEVQMIFQDPYASLDPLNIVHDVVEEGMKIHKLYPEKEAREKRILELLNMVGLNQEHEYRFPHEFSGGQRQRVGIARALSVEPELIVCDEPISALDVSIQAQVVNLLKDLQKKLGLSYLFITHDLSMVKYISDRIAVMYLGGIVELAESQELFDHTMHPYTKALMSAIPIADPDVEQKRRRILLSGDVPSPVNLEAGCAFCKRCGQAKDKCRKERPKLTQVRPGHFVACHFAGE